MKVFKSAGTCLWTKCRHFYYKCEARCGQYRWWRLETLVFLGALLTGFIASYLRDQHEKKFLDSLARQQGTITVVAAGRDLPQGTLLTERMLKIQPLLAAAKTPNYVDVSFKKLILGKRLLVDLKAGDPVLLTAVEGVSAGRRLAQRIPAGKRLFTLSIADRAVAHGFIQPNDHVDVLASIKLPGRGLTTFVLLQDVTIVSVGKYSLVDDHGLGRTAGSDISFFVEDKDIEMLHFAQSQGQFSLALRNPRDSQKNKKSQGIDIRRFLDYEGVHQVSGGSELRVIERGQ